MPDLLLRDTDRDELIRDVAAAVVAQIRPLLASKSGPRLVDGEKLAELTSLSRPTIDRLRASGRIPSIPVGSRRLYRPEAVVAALEEQTRADDD